jgi:carboxypeptidase Taq
LTELQQRDTAIGRLKEVLGEVVDLNRVAELLSWDQETYMPPGGVASRAGQAATVGRLAHERFTSPEVGELLERAAGEVAGLPDDSDEVRLVRVTRRDYDYEVKLPPDLVAEMARASAEAQPVWAEAREKSDWKIFAPRMRVTIDLARRVAEAYDGGGGPMDAMIARQEPGLTAARVNEIFGRLRASIVPLVREIAERADAIDDGVLDRTYDQDRQVSFSLDVVRQLGFDLERGRQDLSRHPFCVGFGPTDVRITTRVRPTIRDSCLFSTIHESGHGMYEQGVASRLDRTPLCSGASSGVHESQSRLWENLVGRSRPFWRHFYPKLRDAFPEPLHDVEEEAFYRAVNKVQPSYIRVDADEVTYNLHIMLRTELETELVEGRLRVDDVPEAWNAKVAEYLGLPAPTDAEGCLQDIHWTFPMVGGFVGYTLGNVIGAQVMETVRRELPDLDERIGAGEFATLHEWLRSRLYTHGRKFDPGELVERVTGSPITVDPWIAYIRTKYGELYGLTR